MYFIGTSIIKDGEIAPLSDQIETGADGEIYELFRVENKRPVFLKEHLARFKNTLKVAGKTLECFDKIESLVEWLLLCNTIKDCNIRLCLSRNGLFQGGFVASSFPTKQMYDSGVRVGILKAMREKPQAKIYHADMRSKADKQQESTETYESLLVDKNGNITEGSRSNVFFIKGETLFTAPDNLVLGGIIRQKVLDICRRKGIKTVMQSVAVDSIADYDAAFISSTPARVLPIVMIGETPLARNNNTLNLIMDELEHEVNLQTQK